MSCPKTKLPALEKVGSCWYICDKMYTRRRKRGHTQKRTHITCVHAQTQAQTTYIRVHHCHRTLAVCYHSCQHTLLSAYNGAVFWSIPTSVEVLLQADEKMSISTWRSWPVGRQGAGCSPSRLQVQGGRHRRWVAHWSLLLRKEQALKLSHLC